MSAAAGQRRRHPRSPCERILTGCPTPRAFVEAPHSPADRSPYRITGALGGNRFAEDPHDLKLRHGGTTYAFPTVASGDAQTQAFALDAGPWRLWCSLPGHAAKGMDITVTVSDP